MKESIKRIIIPIALIAALFLFVLMVVFSEWEEHSSSSSFIIVVLIVFALFVLFLLGHLLWLYAKEKRNDWLSLGSLVIMLASYVIAVIVSITMRETLILIVTLCIIFGYLILYRIVKKDSK